MIHSTNLQRLVEEEKRASAASGERLSSIQELFADDKKVDIDDPNHWSRLYTKESLSAFLNEETSKTNRKAMETMSETKNMLKAKGYKNPWSKESLFQIVNDENTKLDYITSIAEGLFGNEGDTHMRQSFENVLWHSMEALRKDPTGEESIFSRVSNLPQALASMEGMGVAATYQNEDHFSGLLGFAIANYYARCKVMELFYAIKNNEKPEMTYRYVIEYVIDQRTGEKLKLPDAERNGLTEGLFDLMDANPTYVSDVQTPHIFKAADIPVNDGAGEDGWVKVGIRGNLLSDTPGIDEKFNALEPNTRIAGLLYVKDYTGDDVNQPVYAIQPVRIDTGVGEGLSEERRFHQVVTINNAAIIDNGGAIKRNMTVTENIFGYINIDEGDYLITTSNPTGLASCIKGIKFYAKISDTAHLRGGLQTSLQRWVYTLRTEYSNFGTIPINAYIRDNWGLGNNSLGWAATMTDAMSKRYAITRDLKAERHLAEDRERPGTDFKLYDKMGEFIGNVNHDIGEAGSSGTTDQLMNASKKVLKEKIIFSLINCETEMNFDKNIERMWIIMGHEEKIFAFEELSFLNEDYGNDEVSKTDSNLRFGFDIESSAGYKDNYGRKIRVIGAKDKRWRNKDVIGILRSNSLSAPTTVYFPYMFRIFTGIDPRFTNLPSIQFYGRDAFYTLSKAQLYLKVLNLGVESYSLLNKSAKKRYVSDSADD